MILELDRDDYRRLYLALMAEIAEYEEAGNPESEKLKELLERLKKAADKAWPVG